MIKVKINGKDWEIDTQTVVANLLGRFKIKPRVCVVEINGDIISEDKYNQRILKEGDTVEIVRFMAGG
jgi:sulfur carrier protein